MKVVLLERVENLGSIGDVVGVKDGYARNFLLPSHKALRATSANLKVFEIQKDQIIARNAAAKAAAEKAASDLDGSTYIIIRQAGDTGQLYGSVNARDVAEAITESGAKIERNQIVLDTPIKTLGLHNIKVRLHAEVALTITVNVARSQDEADRQAAGENVITSRFEEDRLADEEAAADMLEGGAGQAIADAPYEA
ncbi:50S ribosomal protein L9 [Asticcacaulis sp. EMRT-3]|uniref:50S ribosomal protein L9 n=1 Tax=Asticcacaulis sp. EMRT-3 TaxID=3040349 RepID=UPI0024AFF34D|nr:50S ribosomal protein L9 [Asticcacaulis sp. EMRT-3]MDI7774637.1 50S ribosomal protein L9 [Asticcacaulis sp. EMRT-3]